MDINGILGSANQFFATGIGQIVGEIMHFIYTVLYPSNADAAHDVPLPEPLKP